ncbi:hypothetical protein LguiA_020897 [Lonicera macranthoides]
MGFDNECILNIESLAGEYFCPVCRTLVYPNEAIQSQCTHLYCKPCLTYVVGTTHACPYDGYLVTEEDSKPLIESNKALAETIGKIVVRCLYHRSGCTWQGPLSDCTSHCPGCAFGNSPVVCNRCGVQIVHRQVQEHAQSCSGVNPQPQQTTESVQGAANTGSVSGADQRQVTNQAGAPSSQAQTMPTAAAPPPGQLLNQQANVNPPVQGAAQGGAPTPEQWYQQQYQQNYQQYPGYDSYQQPYQQYYPYQQQPTQQFQQPHQPQVYAQPQPQLQPPHGRPQPQATLQPQTQQQLQAQPQPQSQPPHQPQVPPHGQPQPHPHVQPHNNQAQVSQAQIPPHGLLPPPPPIYQQTQPHLQPHPQHAHVPQYQQPPSQMHHSQPQSQVHVQSQPPPHLQPRPHSQAHPQPQQLQNQPQPYPQHHHLQPSQPPFPNAQPQSQPASAHAVTGNQSYPQAQANQQIHQGPPQQPPMHLYPSSSSLPQAQMHGQFPQQPPQMPSQSSASMASQGQLPSIPPIQQQQIHQPAQQPGHSVHPRPIMQQISQSAPLQYVQQPFPGQALGTVQSQLHQHGHLAQQHPMQSQLVPPGPPHPVPLVQQGMPPHQYGGRPVVPNHGQPSQSYPQSTGAFGAPTVRPMNLGPNQPSGQLNYANRTNNQLQVSSEQHFVQSGLSVTPPGVKTERVVAERESRSPSQKTAEKSASGLGADSLDTKVKSEGEDGSRHGETLGKDTDSEVHVAKDGSGESVTKQTMNEKGKDHTLDSLPGGMSFQIAAAEGKDATNFAPEKVENSVDDSSAGQADAMLRKDVKNLQASAGTDSGSQSIHPALVSNLDGSLQNVSSQGTSQTVVHASHPAQLTDQGRHQLHPMPQQQRPSAPSPFQSGPPPGPPSNAQLPGYPFNPLRPQGPGQFPQQGQPLNPSEQFQPNVFNQPGSFHPNIPRGGFPDSGPTFGTGPGPFGHPQRSFELQSGAPQEQYNQGHVHPGFPRNSQGEPVGGPTTGAVPPGSFDPRSGIMGRSTPHGPEGQFGPQNPINPVDAEVFPNERQSLVDRRHPNSHVPGSFERGSFGQSSGFESNTHRINGAAGLDSSATGCRDESFKTLAEEHLNPFTMGPNRRLDQGEFEKGLKRFPRPSNSGTEGSPKFRSYFDNPQRGFNFDDEMKMDTGGGGAPSHFLPPYHSSDAGERQLPAGFNENNRGRTESAHRQDFLGPTHGFGRHHMETTRSPGREYRGIPPRGFGGDLDGPQNFPTGEHFRNGELIRRVPHNLPSHLHMGEPTGFGPFSGHVRRGEFAGPGTFPNHLPLGESFGGNKSSHPRLGEPGFRSSYSLQEFPNDGRFYAGETDSFDKLRRKSVTTGWCRICKVDCETVEGLDLHSQTREHQKMTMDMVISIKRQNAKKQKTFNDRSSLEETRKPRNPGLKSRSSRAK